MSKNRRSPVVSNLYYRNKEQGEAALKELRTLAGKIKSENE